VLLLREKTIDIHGVACFYALPLQRALMQCDNTLIGFWTIQLEKAPHQT